MTWQAAVTQDGRSAVIAVTGEIDMGSEADLRAAVDAALEHRPRPAEITIDLAQVNFCDSAGIRALLVSHQTAAASGVDLRVRRPQPTVANVLRVTGVNDLLGLPMPPESERPSRTR